MDLQCARSTSSNWWSVQSICLRACVVISLLHCLVLPHSVVLAQYSLGLFDCQYHPGEHAIAALNAGECEVDLWSSGSELAVYGTSLCPSSRLGSATAMVIDDTDGTMYVTADFYGTTIYQIDYPSLLVNYYAGHSGCFESHGVALDDYGTLWVACWGIEHGSANGILGITIGGVSSYLTLCYEVGCNYPTGVAVDQNNLLWITQENQIITCVTIQSWLTITNCTSVLNVTNAMLLQNPVFDSDGNLYVVDSVQSTIYQILLAENFTFAHDITENFANFSLFQSVQGICFDCVGNTYVVDQVAGQLWVDRNATEAQDEQCQMIRTLWPNNTATAIPTATHRPPHTTPTPTPPLTTTPIASDDNTTAVP